MDNNEIITVSCSLHPTADLGIAPNRSHALGLELRSRGTPGNGDQIGENTAEWIFAYCLRDDGCFSIVSLMPQVCIFAKQYLKRNKSVFSSFYEIAAPVQAKYLDGRVALHRSTAGRKIARERVQNKVILRVVPRRLDQERLARMRIYRKLTSFLIAVTDRACVKVVRPLESFVRIHVDRSEMIDRCTAAILAIHAATQSSRHPTQLACYFLEGNGPFRRIPNLPSQHLPFVSRRRFDTVCLLV